MAICLILCVSKQNSPPDCQGIKDPEEGEGPGTPAGSGWWLQVGGPETRIKSPLKERREVVRVYNLIDIVCGTQKRGGGAVFPEVPSFLPCLLTEFQSGATW